MAASSGTSNAQPDYVDLVPSGSDSNEEETGDPVIETTAALILDQLKSPTPATINRLRKTNINGVPPRGKGKCCDDLSSDLTGVIELVATIDWREPFVKVCY